MVKKKSVKKAATKRAIKKKSVKKAATKRAVKKKSVKKAVKGKPLRRQPKAVVSAANRARHYDELRARLKVIPTLAKLDRIQARLVRKPPPDIEEMGALNLQAKICMFKINKVIPTPKTIDLDLTSDTPAVQIGIIQYTQLKGQK